MRREKGITLVALVITIIVLIILVGVTIRAVMNGGLITNAKGAKEEWEIGKTDEEGKLATLLEKLEGKKVTSEKGSIVLENASGENLKNYRIYGKSEQNGEPVEIESVGDFDEAAEQYKIPLTVTGKNLLKTTVVSTKEISIYEPVTSAGYGTTIDSTDLIDNTVTVTQTKYSSTPIYQYNNGFICIATPGLVVGNKYTISFDIDILENPLNATSFACAPGGVLNGVYASFSQNKQRVSCNFVHYDRGGTYRPYVEFRICGMSLTASNFMITEVDEDTEFEPYVEPITTNIFLKEPLRSIGDKADYIDFKEQKVVRYIKEENGVLSELEQPEEEKTTLPNIPTFEGTTNITINTTIQPSKIEVNY